MRLQLLYGLLLSPAIVLGNDDGYESRQLQMRGLDEVQHTMFTSSTLSAVSSASSAVLGTTSSSSHPTASSAPTTSSVPTPTPSTTNPTEAPITSTPTTHPSAGPSSIPTVSSQPSTSSKPTPSPSTSAPSAPPSSNPTTIDAGYKSRQLQMRGLNSVHTGTRAVVRSFLNQPVDQDSQDEIDELLLDLDTDRDAAMPIVILLRILMLTSDAGTEEKVKNALSPIPFWISEGETTRVYWSENMQIMWMSSSWLLREKYPGVLVHDEPTLRKRLLHWLNLKNDYGFFEFFSSVYFPYTMQGLLNLVDFCEDTEIQALAVKVSQKLLSTILLVANNEGSFFPAAGRNYVDYYLGRKAIHDMVWILTGFGDDSTFLSHVLAFLATSQLDMSPVIDNYSVSAEETVSVRPSLSESFAIDGGLSRLDRIIINQWGMGAYFHPDVAEDTQYALDTLDLWNHKEFADFESFASLPTFVGNIGSDLLASVTSSSVLGGHDVKIFKEEDIVLTSVQSFWPGHLGYQVYPWAATVGTKAVWTQSGQVVPKWSDRDSQPSNTHLPSVTQERNVALIIYNPKDDIELIKTFAPNSPLGVDYYEVALRWPDDFENEAVFNHWKFGQDGSGYVAVARHCLDEINSITACNDEYQAWAVIVGNAELYTSFGDFVAKVRDDAVYVSEVRSEFSWWPLGLTDYFYGTVEFDGITISSRI